MVQTIYYYLDSNAESRHHNSTTKSQPEKNVLQKNISSNVCLEHAKLKGKRSHCIRLQPLNVGAENNAVLNATERKFSDQLNHSSFKSAATSNQKKTVSKIPVLQRKTKLKSNPKTDDGHCDTNLSAADRRQKFHQSRLCAAGVCTNDVAPVLKKQQTPLHCDWLPWYEGYVVHKLLAPPGPVASQKSILPPIKPVDVSVGPVPKTSQPKSKCLLGEITHFPALCNPLCSKGKKNYSSTVPHLPPIMPPAAPPPSISSSLENDQSKVNGRTLNTKKNDEWNPSKAALQKLIPV